MLHPCSRSSERGSIVASVPHQMDQILACLASDPAQCLNPENRSRLLDHIGQAAFSPRVQTLAEWAPNSSAFNGWVHPSVPTRTVNSTTKLNALEWHTLKRIQRGEWPPGTTSAEYLADVQVAARAAADLHVGCHEGCEVSGAYSPLQQLPASARVVRQSGRVLLALYNSARGFLKTGYTVDAAKVVSKMCKWTNYRCL